MSEITHSPPRELAPAVKPPETEVKAQSLLAISSAIKGREINRQLASISDPKDREIRSKQLIAPNSADAAHFVIYKALRVRPPGAELVLKNDKTELSGLKLPAFSIDTSGMIKAATVSGGVPTKDGECCIVQVVLAEGGKLHCIVEKKEKGVISRDLVSIPENFFMDCMLMCEGEELTNSYDADTKKVAGERLEQLQGDTSATITTANLETAFGNLPIIHKIGMSDEIKNADEPKDPENTAFTAAKNALTIAQKALADAEEQYSIKVKGLGADPEGSSAAISKAKEDHEKNMQKLKTDLSAAQAALAAAEKPIKNWNSKREIEATNKDLTPEKIADLMASKTKESLNKRSAELDVDIKKLEAQLDTVRKAGDNATLVTQLEAQLKAKRTEQSSLIFIDTDKTVLSEFARDLQSGAYSAETVKIVQGALEGGNTEKAVELLTEKAKDMLTPPNMPEAQKKEVNKTLMMLGKVGGFLLIGLLCALVDVGSEGKLNLATIISSLMNSGRYGSLTRAQEAAIQAMNQAERQGKKVTIDPKTGQSTFS